MANTDEPATEAANGAGGATMNRRRVTTPRPHRLRSVVSGTRGYLVRNEGQATDRPVRPGQSVANVDMRVGRTRCAIVLPTYATTPATNGATSTSSMVVNHGNAMCAVSDEFVIARTTTATGMKPVGTATAAPANASSAAFHADTRRIVVGRAPSDTSMSRSSRVSAADNASDIARTINAI